jgi:hypothetical protein
VRTFWPHHTILHAAQARGTSLTLFTDGLDLIEARHLFFRDFWSSRGDARPPRGVCAASCMGPRFFPADQGQPYPPPDVLVSRLGGEPLRLRVLGPASPSRIVRRDFTAPQVQPATPKRDPQPVTRDSGPQVGLGAWETAAPRPPA